MKKLPVNAAVVLAAASILPYSLLHAQIYWDGGGGNDVWSNGTNWSTDTVPTTADDVIIDVNTNLGDTSTVFDWRLDYSGANIGVANMTVDLPQFQLWDSDPGSNRDNFAMTGNGSTLTITDSWTNTNTGVSLFRNVDLLGPVNGGTGNIVNNAADDTIMRIWNTRLAGNVASFVFKGTSNGVIEYVSASEVLGGNQIKLYVLDDTYNGTQLWNSTVSGAINPTNTFRIRGGRAEMGSDDQINTAAGVVIEDIDGNGAELAFMDTTDDFGTLYIREQGGTLEINGSDVTIAEYNNNTSGAGTIDITNWVDGTSSIAFTDASGFSEFAGLVSDGDFALLSDVTIDGGDAYLYKDGAGAYISIPEPSTFAAMFGALALAIGVIRRRR